jgi:hypothetical protein
MARSRRTHPSACSPSDPPLHAGRTPSPASRARQASRIWPERFWVCGEAPEMICSDSFYCNWTNNPQMWEVAWWNREYVEQFDKFKRNDPWWDLESYMNWEPNS